MTLPFTDLWRAWWIGWHQGAISRHQRLLVKYDPQRELRELRERLVRIAAGGDGEEQG